MRVLVFDTETTWIYNKKEKDLSRQPYIIQFAWIIADMKDNWEYEIERKVDILIKPPIPIPYEVSKIHHIYDIDVANKKTFEEEASEIASIISSVDIIVAHNLSFDKNMLLIEFWRLLEKGLPYDYAPKMELCTMENTINYCRLPKKNEKSKGFKRPKLQELTKKTLGVYFTGAHNALVDVEWTLKALSVLVRNKVVKLEKTEELTLF